MAILLLATLLVPVAGAILNDGNGRRMRWVALGATLISFVLAAFLIGRFPGGTEEFGVLDLSWLGWTATPANIRFSIGLDGLSLWLFGLTTLLMIVAVLVSWEAIAERASTYYSLLLLLETGMLGVFVARDVILFYIFFEFTLVPLFFLIGIWGSSERRYAAAKFFLFTFAGSVLTFLGLLAIVLWNYYQNGVLTFSIPELTANIGLHPIDPPLQRGIFLLLFAGFAIKVPLFPLHTWLPLAHVEAPTAGSVLLAGVLLKVGSYGFVRFALPLLPEAVASLMPLLLWLCVAGIIYGALVALVQEDIKRLIAYSSVSHLGFCMLGVFALNELGMQGGVLQMINHGLSTGGLFALVGMLYERYHTRQIKDYSGMARRLPVLAFFMVLFALSSIGLPGLNGFAGEFLLLLGMFRRAWAETPHEWSMQLKVISVLATSGVVLGAWYMLWMIQRVFFGPLQEPKAESAGHGHQPQPVRDLSLREVLALAPLVVFIVWIGVQPQFFLGRMGPTLETITARTALPLERRMVGLEGKGSGFKVQGSELQGRSFMEEQTTADRLVSEHLHLSGMEEGNAQGYSSPLSPPSSPLPHPSSPLSPLPSPLSPLPSPLLRPHP
jgi:NADH-quinone oxidoreductase subunit M